LTLGIQPILLGSILLLLSGLNVIVGNLMGTAQTNIKRMLGYSTIAQMGYIILAIAVGLRNGSLPAIQSGLFILVSHACAKGLAFLSAGVFNQSAGIHELKDLRSHSGLALFPVFSMALAALSLAAVPPFPGFTGKWMVLTSLFQTEDPFRFVMAMVLLSGSLIAFGYYLPLLVNLFSRLIQEKEPEGTRANTKLSLWFSLPLAFLGIVILWFTLFPQVLLDGVAPVAEYLLEGMI
jgi:formate hydrogenlyase subunit 3/multisubunit Na+/H+ antiporter MnhD subunit